MGFSILSLGRIDCIVPETLPRIELANLVHGV